MNENQLLSIVIPTYNRAELLDYCLGVHIPLVKDHNIKIYIFDNASTDATSDIVKSRIAQYPLIEFHRNEMNVGPDDNFEQALKYPKTEYVWLLGDSYLMPSGGVDYLIDVIKAGVDTPDVLIFNLNNEINNISEKNYTDQNLLLLDLGSLMTCMSCLVFSKKIITNANWQRYRNTYFIQTAIIFEYIANKDFNARWMSQFSVKRWCDFNGIKKESWQSNTFDIWFKNRANFIMSLPPSYDLDIKLKTIFSSKVTMKSLFSIRASGILNLKTYYKYKYLFPITIEKSIFTIFLISIIPRFVFKLLREVKIKLI